MYHSCISQKAVSSDIIISYLFHSDPVSANFIFVKFLFRYGSKPGSHFARNLLEVSQ